MVVVQRSEIRSLKVTEISEIRSKSPSIRCRGNFRFPVEEKYSLIDQIRRSSRSVCTNLREAWAKRRYEAHFVSKLTDADGENAETETWLDFACDGGYLLKPEHAKLVEKCHEVGAMLGSIIQNPSSFIPKSLSASG